MEPQCAEGQQQWARLGSGGATDAVAESNNPEWRPDMAGGHKLNRRATGRQQGDGESGPSGATYALGDRQQPRLEGHARNVGDGSEPRRDGPREAGPVAAPGAVVPVAHAGHQTGCAEQPEPLQECGSRAGQSGFWSDYRIIGTRDGKFRRIPNVEPVFQRVVDEFSARMDALRDSGASESEISEIQEAIGGFPLAGKIPGRVGLLKGSGNCIVVELAAQFIRAFI